MIDRQLGIRSLMIAAIALVAAACGDGSAVSEHNSSGVASSTGVTTVPSPPTQDTHPVASSQVPATDASTSTTTSTSVVDPSTTAPDITPVPSDRPVVLRPDGLGPYAFMTPRSEVEPWLTLELGQPEPYTADGPLLVACGPAGCEEAEVLWWRDAGLLVAFAHRDLTGKELPAPVLTSWTVTVGPWWPGKISEPANVFDPALVPTRLTTADGVGLGMTASELERTRPSTEFLAWNGTFVPNGFSVPAADGDARLEGDLDWNVVTDLQRALNAAGADLGVDGVAGARTQAALVDYQGRNKLQGWRDVFNALAVTEPDPESQVVRLSAGWWWWEFACGGELEVFGLPDQC